MKKRRVKKSVIRIFGSILLYIGYILIIMPFIFDQYSRIGQTAQIKTYDNLIENMDDDIIQNQFILSRNYNAKLSEKYANEMYRYSSTTDYDEEYLQLPLADNKQICTLIIPKINVNLPVGHGTQDDLLQVMAGHLYGTSLPVGGPSTHGVIAAHSGLRSSELFSRLDELVIGDEIDILVLNELHTYKVKEIRVVLPDECDQYMQIIPNEDLITLYGINTHRLLVQAERVEDKIVEQDNSFFVFSDDSIPKIIISSLIILPIICLIVFNLCIKKGAK